MATNYVKAMQDIDSAVLAQICEDCRISTDDVEDVYACTPFQAGLLADGADYTQRLIHSLDTSLELDRFCASLHEVISSNEIVRTRIVDCALGLVQVVVKGAALTDYVSRPLDADLEQYLKNDRLTPMHLATPLARFAIIGRKLVTTIHHAIADSYTHRFLFEDVCRIYQGASPSRRAPFKEFVNYCRNIDTTSAAMFWKSQFSQGTPPIFPSIPSGHSVKASQAAVRCISLTKTPPLPLIPAYIEVAMAMTVADYTGSDSVIFGYVLSGRGAALAGAETTLGPTMSTVPMQVNVKAGTTVEELLKSRNNFRRSLLTSPFLQYGLASIRHSVSKDARFASRFQTLLDILPHDETEIDTPGLTLEGATQTHGYALCLLVQLVKDAILIKADFDPVVLPEAQVQHVLRQMEHRLKALSGSSSSTKIEQLSSLNFGDTLELLDWNREIPEGVERCLHDLFALQVGQRPDDAAVDAWDGSATYRELDEMSDDLAQELLHRNITMEEPIPFALERSLSTVVAVLGIMKAGGACVPIDVSLPKARKETFVRIVGARFVVTSSSHKAIADCASLIITLRPRPAAGQHKRPTSDSGRAAYIVFTSGSTGQPKGVVLEHRSMATSYLAICNRIGWTSGTRVLQFSSTAWDACALEMLGPLIVGGCVCIPSNESRESALGEYINRANVDSAIQTPTALRNLTPEDVLPSLKSLILGGEPIPQTASRTWGRKVRLFHAWGPCETSVISSIAELNPASVHPTTIGTPVGCAVWIVDRNDTSKLVPIGAVGEMLVEGPGVAREYYKNPTQTTSCFIPAPSFIPKARRASRKVYRTGDLARYNANGSIEFIGRRDNQVKIRGQRFELEEIEEVIGRHPYTREAIMATFKSPGQERQDLTAFLTLTGVSDEHLSSENRDDVEIQQVRLNESSRHQLQVVHDFVRACLPPYMVPTAWVVVNYLPKLASTKVDRAKLRHWLDELDLSAARDLARELEGETCSPDLTPPATHAERVLQQAWSSVLTLEEDRIGRESSFLRHGGDSITAMQVATRCQKQGFPISTAVLLRTRTLEEAAREGETLRGACATPLKRTSGDLQLLESDRDSISRIHAHLASLGVARENVESIYPCTALQEGILLAQMKPDWEEDRYSNRFAFKLSSRFGEEIDTTRVVDAWKALCAAHPILRTVFTSGVSRKGAFQQIVLKHSEPSVSIKRVQENCSDTTELFKDQVKRPFAQNEPPHRLSLYEGLPGKAVYAVLDISHAIFDARTMRMIWEHIAAEYSSRGVTRKGQRFSDYVASMQEREEAVHQYWKTYVAGGQPCILHRDSTMMNPSVRGLEVPFQNAPDLSTFCRGQGVTLANFMEAAWGVVLRLYTGLSSVYFGSVRSDQDRLVSAENMLGPLVTMMVRKFDFADRSMSGLRLLETAQEDAARGLENSGCSLAHLHDDLGLLTSPLFDTVMAIMPMWPADLALGDEGLIIHPMEGEGTTEYSISVNVRYSEDKLIIHLSYQRAHLSDTLVGRIARTFAKVIANIMTSPDQPVLSGVKAEEPEACPSISSADKVLLQKWNSKTLPKVKECFPQRARAVVQRQPFAPAVCSWDRSLDYGQLDMLSDYLAHRIRLEYGIGAEVMVPFACEKAASAIVIMLAISKTGAAFVPLDITQPPKRLAAIVADASASLIIVNSSALRDMMETCTRTRIFLASVDDVLEETSAVQISNIRRELESVVIKPSNAAYVVYTSGSTGRPKGVLVEHGNVAVGAEEHARRLGMTTQSRVLQLASFSFDMAIADVVYALSCGACLCVPSERERTDDIAGVIDRLQANFLWTTPTQASSLLPEEVPTLRTMSLAGEPLRRQDIETWAPHVRLTNSYGPAEAAIMVSCKEVAIGDKVAQDIGHPSCCRFWIVNPDNPDYLAPIGTSGELVIEGPVVARGYLNNSKATASCFIDPPAWTKASDFASLDLASQRFYKSGDMVTQAGEKSFIIQGRKDNQVKIRGQRVEIGEIEYHLRRHAEPRWHWAVEIIQPSAGADPCLAAFFAGENSSVSAKEPASGHGLLKPLAEQAATAREMLKHIIPAYMIPEYFIHLRALPTLSSLKTDRAFLRTVAASLSRADLQAYRASESPHDMGNADFSRYESRMGVTDDQIFMQQAWADVLGIPLSEVTANDNFFALGGNSIRAINLVASLRRSGRQLSVGDVVQARTLADMVSTTALLSASAEAQLPTTAIDPENIPCLVQLADRWPWLETSNIESVAPVTDTQAWMLDVSERAGRGFDNGLALTPLPEHALDKSKLQRACREVVRQHAILRTVFVRQESQLFQVVLRVPPIEQVHADKALPMPGQQPSILSTLPSFYLTTDGGHLCQKLELRIHHALYDAISLGHLLDDLSAAYSSRILATRPTQFHEWISHVNGENRIEAYRFWRELLRGPVSNFLVCRSDSSADPLDSRISFMRHGMGLPASHGTDATIFNAAWSLVLSQVLDEQDIVFGYLNANRSSAFPYIDQIVGPCVNVLPVRARLNCHITTASFVAELQKQSTDSIPYQHVGLLSIVKDYTQWPTSRLRSIVVFQNHESLGDIVKVGDVDCAMSPDGRVGDSADIWLAATPQVDGQIRISLCFSSARVPNEKALWMAAYLDTALDAFSTHWTKPLDEIRQHIKVTCRYPVCSGTVRFNTERMS